MTPAPEFIGRKLLRPGLIGLPRVATALKAAGYDFAADEGLGSLPDPAGGRPRVRFREVKGLPKNSVIEGSYATLIEVRHRRRRRVRPHPVRAGGATREDMSTVRASSLRHVRPVQPLRFPEQEPESERMGQGRRHLYLCRALHAMLRAVSVPAHTVGADQFVYFDAADPRRCVAPDSFVTLGVVDHDFDSYKVWEEGTPDVAFEVLSPSDSPERWTFEEKLLRYHALGVRELVTFHVDAAPDERLRSLHAGPPERSITPPRASRAGGLPGARARSG